MAKSIIKLINYLESKKSETPALSQHASGPIRPIYSVNFRHFTCNTDIVPIELTKLISAISSSGGPYDKSVEKTSRTDETVGAMRQIHSNLKPSWLPHAKKPDRGKRSGGGSREQAYDHYIAQFKKQTNDNGGANITTGYIEYTASDEHSFSPKPTKRARIVFDYVRSRLFFSPQHYHSWEIRGDVINLISGNEAEFDKKHPNAFYWITDITSAYTHSV